MVPHTSSSFIPLQNTQSENSLYRCKIRSRKTRKEGIVRIQFTLCLGLCLATLTGSSADAAAQAPAPAPLTLTAEQDQQNMMNQLGIKALRPGPSGDEKAANHANYDESRANPY